MMRFLHVLALALGLAVGPPAAAAPAPGEPLFASSDPLHLSIEAPIARLVANRSEGAPPVAGTLTVAGEAPLAIRLKVRGITRRAADICQFPPLFVEFATAPPAASVFAGQKKLKLVTHCQRDPAYAQRLLVEYGAYRMLNALTPISFEARLAQIDYLEPGRPVASHPAFFLEAESALARRNGMSETKYGADAPGMLLSPADAARTALFEYLIGNVDWAMMAGPKGAHCCHNMKLLARADSPKPLVPVPYDFDFSGLVHAPYATAPEGIGITDVRTRRYRGYCAHNPAVAPAAAAIATSRAAMLAAFDATPGLAPETIARAHDYLAPGFDAIASDSLRARKLLATCLH